MKKLTPPDIKNIKRSFASRLSLVILAVSAVMFMVAAAVFLISVGRLVKQEATNHAQSELSNTVHIIDDLLHQVQVTTTGMEWAVRRKLNSPDELIELVVQMNRNHPHIVGSCIAFRPNYFPEKGEMFAPYAYKDKEGNIIRHNLGNAEYNYHAQPWYVEPTRRKQALWTEPYFDDGGADDIITTFSHPLKDENGEVFAILTADISLRQFADLVLAIRPYPNAYCFMLDRKGTYLVHHKRERILYQNIAEATDYMADRSIENLIEGMLSGRTGMEKIMDGDMPCYTFFTPIKTTGWPLALVCPRKEVYAAMDSLSLLVAIVFVVGGVIQLLVSRWIIHRYSKPLHQFSEAATRVARGDLHFELPKVNTKDELEHFRDTFAYMQHSLRKYIHELKSTTAIKERMEGELHVARRIQMGMIPKIFPAYPDRIELDLYGHLRPAREVGGDLYDFFINGNKLYIAVGDVSGKGIPASLVMAITCRLIRLIAEQTDSPAEMATILNNSIARDNDTNMFVTMILGVMDLTTGEFTCCNAGHNPPILAQAGKEADFYNIPANLPIGIMGGFEYTEHRLQLPDHAAFFIYTDGVNEAENEKAEQFGNARMLSTVKRHSHESTRSIVNTMLDEVDNFAAQTEQSDDITMLCLRYHKNFNGNPSALAPKTLTIANKLAELEKLQEFVENYCASLPTPPSLVLSLNLAIEEAMVNCINYAYPKGSEGEISLHISWDDVQHVLKFVLSDAGTPFDPTAVPEPDTTLGAEDRPIGGLGILLVRKIMDTVSYRRENEQNVLTMCKKIYAHADVSSAQAE